jgi:hypothetical protein
MPQALLDRSKTLLELRGLGNDLGPVKALTRRSSPRNGVPGRASAFQTSWAAQLDGANDRAMDRTRKPPANTAKPSSATSTLRWRPR